jgi:D-proline reductase (dithiol) PrdB
MSFVRLKQQLLARIFTAFPSLAARWGRRLAMNTGEIPWAVPEKPLKRAVLALVTTGGVHLKNKEPFSMADPEGDPSYREIPVDAPRDLLTITHDYYDHRDAEKDLNLVLPLQRLQEMAAAGALGALHPVAYSLMGHIDGPHLQTLQEKTAPEIARRLAAARVDYALLVPA